MKKIFHLLVAFSWGSVAGAQALKALAQSWNGRLRAVESYVEAQRIARRIPGMTVGVTAAEAEWVQGFGLADLENGAITKPMTAVAIMQLVEQGKIDLDADIRRYVPYFPQKKWTVTARDILSHVAGITDYQSAAEERITEHKTTRQSVAIFEDRPLVFAPRSEFYYTSYGYNLLGAAIEEVMGKSYDSYMRDAVWDPLGMLHMTMDDPAIVMPNRVRGYRMENGRIMNAEFVDVSSRGPAGGTRGTVGDLLAFGRGMYERKLLSASSYEAMWAERRTTTGRATGYGLGWDVSPSDAGVYVVGHTGSQQETATVLHVFPSRKLAIAIAANLEHADVSAIARRVFELLTGERAAPRAYMRETRDARMLDVLHYAFVNGRAEVERRGAAAVVGDTNAVRESFARVNRSLSRIERGDTASIGNATDDDFKRVGAFVATQLVDRIGDRRATAVARDGAIGFFAAWIRATPREATLRRPSRPAWARFDTALERRIADWSTDWRVTLPTAEALDVVPGANIAAPLRQLRRQAVDKSVYPDLSAELTEAVQAHSLAARHEQALEIGAAIEELYPRLSNPSSFHGAYGLALIAAGRNDEGLRYLRRAHERNAGGITSSAKLARIAGDYAHNGMTPAARTLFGLAMELHPRNSAVRYQFGEVLYRGGELASAAALYREALAINPAFANAGEAKERLRKIEAVGARP